MSFCANCGQQYDGTTRFCGTCGTEFGAAPADSADHPVTSIADLPAGLTRANANPGAGHPGQPAEEPDPFASWFQPDAHGEAAGGDSAGAQWQPTQTVSAARPPAAGYPTTPTPPAPPGPAFPPTMPPPYPPAAPPARGGRRGLFITVAVIVVLAAGGGAYALASMVGKHSGTQPPAQPAAGASAQSTPPGNQTGAASAPASGSPAPSPALSLVAVAPGVTPGAAGPDVETLLSHYFHGINSHDYAEYASTLNTAEQAKQPQSTFDSGYATTTDSGMTLTSLTGNGGGGLTATVSFTSRQSPGQSVDKSACNNWTLNFYLVAQGSSGYLVGPAPSSYQPTYSDC